MKEKLEQLTEEQISKFPEYVSKWLSIGLSTSPMDRDKAKEAACEAYKLAGLKSPGTFIFLDSPMQGCVAAYLVSKYTSSNISEDQIKEAIKELTAKKNSKEVQSDIFNQLQNACYGSLDAPWLSFYDYFMKETSVENLDSIKGLIDVAQHCGFWWAFKDVVILTEKPVTINMVNKVLHKDLAPSIVYRDGFAVYSLNGIRMKEEYVMTPAKNLSVQDVMKEQNVDVRRELLKKIGLERFVKETNAKELDRLEITVCDKKVLYQLLDIELGDGVTARVLKMDNPSIDAVHVEGVEDEGDDACKTVKEALAWRAGFTKSTYKTYTAPVALS